MNGKIRRTHLYSVIVGHLMCFLFVQQASSATYLINTNDPPTITINSNHSSPEVNGKVVQKTFKGPNGGNWTNSIAQFDIPDNKKSIFASGTVSIKGNHSLSLNINGNFTLGADLDISGRLVDGLPGDSTFMIGGFVRTSNSCCVLGAGPGAAFGYHGAGHGGRGGGYYQDHNSSRLYSWDYHDMEYLLGGSTSTVMFASKPGSGGGAIEIIANGTLTINATIKANGFTSNSTHEDHCAGGSAGGLIRLKGKRVIIQRKLSANGGDSGRSTYTKRRCGDGGGGGVIQVFSTHDNKNYQTDKSRLEVHGGQGLEKGESGVIFNGVFFDDDTLDVNTNSCSMKWMDILMHQGSLSSRIYRTKNNTDFNYKVCTFVFESDVYLGSKANILVTGANSLKIESKNGSIQLLADVQVTDKGVGGYVVINKGPATVTECNSKGLFGNDFDTLIGGSVCTLSNSSSHDAKGGGAIELQAINGAIVIDSRITVDGSSNNDGVGAMGGIIRLNAKQVHLKDTAFLSAKSSQKGTHLASGGIIQIKSNEDVQGLCESKFNVSGGRQGLVNVMTSAKSSYQVQFILDGTLVMDTDSCTWVYNPKSSVSIAYSQLGTKKNTSILGYTVTECSFEFQTPIIINGSTSVQLSGAHALSIQSKEGIYIGVDLIINSSHVTGVRSFLGGYCAGTPTLAKNGLGPGRGFPNINAGGGHGGRGGLFREESDNVYGKQYGVDMKSLIGGSTGTSNSSAESRGCGGGAIRIASQGNLTIDGKIHANGYSSVLSGSSGGNAGGAIILIAKKVTLAGRAELQAKGSDAKGSVQTGGGAGGVIAINSTNRFGNEPNVTVATAGGRGSQSGECGAVIINGKVLRKDYKPVVEISKDFVRCSQAASSSPSKLHKMLEHKARPATCLNICKDESSSFALINGHFCYCVSEVKHFEMVSNDSCNKSCPATHQYRCGGTNNRIFSVYRTGINTGPVEPTERPFEQPSKEFEALNNVNLTKANAPEVVLLLNNLTAGQELNGGDTLIAVSIMNKLASGKLLAPRTSNETKQSGQAIIETASVLLTGKNSETWKRISSNENETFTPNSVLKMVEEIGVHLGSGLEPDDHVTLESRHLALGLERHDVARFKGATYPVYEDLSKAWQFEDSIAVPQESLSQLKHRGENYTTVVFVLYNGIDAALSSNLEKGRMINSRILSLKFDQSFLAPFVKPVNITLTKRQNWENLTQAECSFLDFSNSSRGDWSKNGCVMTSSVNDPKVQCQCDHLTNFAVLMQVKEFKISRSHQKALQMISYIGCGISLFGLALTLATFLSLETLASERTSIHKNLVIALGLAQIIFLAGIDVVYNYIACKVVALALHYLYMAAFAWMCCEGIHLYTKVIEVFSSEASKMKYYYMLGWGAPLIIVIISGASRIEGYGTQTACWISIQDGLIWAFVGPMLIIMCINFVVMVMVIKVILASVTSIQTPGNTSQVKAGLKGMVVLLPLLGLTWVFGLMAVSEKTIAFQYVFAILNSLQGLFIFAFHCIGNSEVRVAYKRLHEKRTLGKMPEHSLSSGNHHKNAEDFKKRMNSRETNSTGDEDIIITKAIRSVSDVKLSGAQDHVAMQTFGDADSGRWSLNCPSPDPPCISYLPTPTTRSPRREPQASPSHTDVLQHPITPRESYRSNRNIMAERNRFVMGDGEGQINGYQRF